MLYLSDSKNDLVEIEDMNERYRINAALKTFRNACLNIANTKLHPYQLSNNSIDTLDWDSVEQYLTPLVNLIFNTYPEMLEEDGSLKAFIEYINKPARV